jgi:hypothetical protein
MGFPNSEMCLGSPKTEPLRGKADLEHTSSSGSTWIARLAVYVPGSPLP